MEYAIIGTSLLFTTAGQILQKLAVRNAGAMAYELNFFNRVARQAEIWWAILCLTIGAVLWLCVLYLMEVSKAFPFLSLGFVLILLVSRFYLGEKIPASRWVGLIFICVGIFIISSA